MHTAAPFVLVGDLQRTMWVERLALREQNDVERTRVVELIAKELDAAYVFYLGDLVDVGGRIASWTYFDALTQPLRARGIAQYALYGNHDYFGDANIYRDALPKRFENLRAGVYGQMPADPAGQSKIELVFLDSNRDVLQPAVWRAQLDWLAATLTRLDQDPHTRGVIALLHHPPFTNSWIDREHASVREDLLPRLQACRKLMLTVSGHSHAYEHFLQGGKHFIVSGGGGGARQELRQGFWRRRDDLFAGGLRRPFHFLRCQPVATGIDITAVGFDKGEVDSREFDKLHIDFSS